MRSDRDENRLAFDKEVGGFWSRLALRRQLLIITVGIGLGALAITLLLRPGNSHPHYSKSQVIAAALKGFQTRHFTRIEAKLMWRHDFERAAPEWSSSDSDGLIWVVAFSGDYGIGPSFGCCSVPADYPGHNTWGIAIIEDNAPTPEPKEFEANWRGEWPPFFDGLPDLAAAG